MKKHEYLYTVTDEEHSFGYSKWRSSDNTPEQNQRLLTMRNQLIDTWLEINCKHEYIYSLLDEVKFYSQNEARLFQLAFGGELSEAE